MKGVMGGTQGREAFMSVQRDRNWGENTCSVCCGWSLRGEKGQEKWLCVRVRLFLGGFVPLSLYTKGNACLCVFRRSLLGKVGQRDSEVLKVCRTAEQGLHTLPCSWARVEPHAWSHAEELPKVVRGCIFQEQTRPIWIEEGDD